MPKQAAEANRSIRKFESMPKQAAEAKSSSRKFDSAIGSDKEREKK